ncbi:PREDICTED: sulfotransferase 1C2A-like [Amphimedon queenslandica]|uniref:Sulfotransferase domain-containing protein n=1 Tax=Amphimedon queenslandica TaxID=400682 RepID=A0AAN0J6N4_AMPQE|nr:PREDICTED: sulfotransferase 1C2A-like [Amphimedon queenslandica]|eukprot:XP_019852689.1 PREDICTED: sulfotransferase 1C2A-like [Amphimedon queenslandica]
MFPVGRLQSLFFLMSTPNSDVLLDGDHFVNGILFPDPVLREEEYKKVLDFPLQSDDTFVTSYPKSGTIWTVSQVKLIKEKVQELSGSISGATVPLSKMHLADSACWPEEDGKELGMAIPYPRTLGSHMPYHMVPGGEPHKSPAKYIYVMRNPKDVSISFHHYFYVVIKRKNEIKFDDYFEMFVNGNPLYGSWFDHVLQWWEHRDASNILIVRFEEMKKDLHKSIRTISQFMGHNLDESTINAIAEECTFDRMKANPLLNLDTSRFGKKYNKDYTYMRKGVVGDWKNHLSPEQTAKFDAVYHKKIDGSGLDFGI